MKKINLGLTIGLITSFLIFSVVYAVIVFPPTTNTGSILVGSGTNRMQNVASGTAGYVLTATGTSPYVSWEAAVAGGITSLNSLSGATQTFATSSDTNIGLSVVSTGTSHTFTPYWIGTLADGRISSAATWNAKQDALGFTPANSTITLSGTAGRIIGGGNLTSNRTFDLATTTATAGSYMLTNLTVDAYGRITAASDGTGGGGGVATTTPFTSGYVPYTTSSLSLTNSNIFQLNGNIGIGTTAPSSTLHVAGTVQQTAVTSTLLAADSTGKVVAAGISGYIPFHWSAVSETGGKINSCIVHFSSTSTIQSPIYAGNKTNGDTITFNLGYSTGKAANTTTTLSRLFNSDQTITATSTPGISLTINASSTPGKNTCLTYWTSAGTSTEFFVNGFYTTLFPTQVLTYTKQPSTKDSYLVSRSDAINTNYGTDTSIQISGNSTVPDLRRGILNFDISSLPAGAVVSSAKLYLYYYSYADYDPKGLAIDVVKITRNDWVESEVTWNSYKSGSTWTTAGGDYVTSTPAMGSTKIPASYGWIDWEIKAIVEDAIANVGGSVNVLVKYTAENTSLYYASFLYSSNFTDNTSLRPKLVIEYTIP